MQMATRIRRAWDSLAARVPSGRVDRGFVEPLAAWLADELPHVSVHAAEALSRAPGIRLVRAGDATTLPMSLAAAAAFSRVLRQTELPRDPVAFVQLVDELCRGLAVFRPEDDSCPTCQGDLELWSDGARTFDCCAFLGCGVVEAGGRAVTPAPPGLRPANVAEVRARYPEARLLPP